MTAGNIFYDCSGKWFYENSRPSQNTNCKVGDHKPDFKTFYVTNGGQNVLRDPTDGLE